MVNWTAPAAPNSTLYLIAWECRQMIVRRSPQADDLKGLLAGVQATTDASDEFYRNSSKFGDDAAASIKRQNDLLNQEAQHWKDLIDPLAAFHREFAQIDDLFKAGMLSAAEWASATDIVSKEMGKIGKSADEASSIWKKAAGEMQSSMATGFFDLMTGKTANFGAAFLSMTQHMIADWLAAQAQMALFGDFAKSGNIGGLLGKAWAAISGPSYVTGGMPAGTVMSGMDSADIALGSFATGTNYVPRTGLYQLHQGETVTPNRGSGGDSTFRGTIINHTTGKIDKASWVPMPSGERALLIEEAVSAMAAQWGDPNSKNSRALSRNMARSLVASATSSITPRPTTSLMIFSSVVS
jgi:hypothetical protein